MNFICLWPDHLFFLDFLFIYLYCLLVWDSFVTFFDRKGPLVHIFVDDEAGSNFFEAQPTRGPDDGNFLPDDHINKALSFLDS